MFNIMKNAHDIIFTKILDLGWLEPSIFFFNFMYE